MATTEEIKALRDETGVSIMQCKKALEEAGGDMDKAKVILRKQSAIAATKKADRTLGAGVAAAYVHAGGAVVGAVVLASETDFVSKNEEFIALARDIAMHVAASNPKYIAKSEIDEVIIAKATEIFTAEIGDKPEEMRVKILAGKMDSYFKEQILMEQTFIKNGETTIGEMITGAVQKFGENVSIARIYRVSVK